MLLDVCDIYFIRSARDTVTVSTERSTPQRSAGVVLKSKKFCIKMKFNFSFDLITLERFDLYFSHKVEGSLR